MGTQADPIDLTEIRDLMVVVRDTLGRVADAIQAGDIRRQSEELRRARVLLLDAAAECERLYTAKSS